MTVPEKPDNDDRQDVDSSDADDLPDFREGSDRRALPVNGAPLALPDNGPPCEPDADDCPEDDADDSGRRKSKRTRRSRRARGSARGARHRQTKRQPVVTVQRGAGASVVADGATVTASANDHVTAPTEPDVAPPPASCATAMETLAELGVAREEIEGDLASLTARLDGIGDSEMVAAGDLRRCLDAMAAKMAAIEASKLKAKLPTLDGLMPNGRRPFLSYSSSTKVMIGGVAGTSLFGVVMLLGILFGWFKSDAVAAVPAPSSPDWQSVTIDLQNTACFQFCEKLADDPWMLDTKLTPELIKAIREDDRTIIIRPDGTIDEGKDSD